MAAPSYFVPVVTPSIGSVLVSPKCNVVVAYDTGSEFPVQPFEFYMAWANCLWQQVGTSPPQGSR